MPPEVYSHTLASTSERDDALLAERRSNLWDVYVSDPVHGREILARRLAENEHSLNAELIRNRPAILFEYEVINGKFVHLGQEAEKLFHESLDGSGGLGTFQRIQSELAADLNQVGFTVSPDYYGTGRHYLYFYYGNEAESRVECVAVEFVGTPEELREFASNLSGVPIPDTDALDLPHFLRHGVDLSPDNLIASALAAYHSDVEHGERAALLDGYQELGDINRYRREHFDSLRDLEAEYEKLLASLSDEQILDLIGDYVEARASAGHMRTDDLESPKEILERLKEKFLPWNISFSARPENESMVGHLLNKPVSSDVSFLQASNNLSHVPDFGSSALAPQQAPISAHSPVRAEPHNIVFFGRVSDGQGERLVIRMAPDSPPPGDLSAAVTDDDDLLKHFYRYPASKRNALPVFKFSVEATDISRTIERDSSSKRGEDASQAVERVRGAVTAAQNRASNDRGGEGIVAQVTRREDKGAENKNTSVPFIGSDIRTFSLTTLRQTAKDEFYGEIVERALRRTSAGGSLHRDGGDARRPDSPPETSPAHVVVHFGNPKGLLPHSFVESDFATPDAPESEVPQRRVGVFSRFTRTAEVESLLTQNNIEEIVPASAVSSEIERSVEISPTAAEELFVGVESLPVELESVLITNESDHFEIKEGIDEEHVALSTSFVEIQQVLSEERLEHEDSIGGIVAVANSNVEIAEEIGVEDDMVVSRESLVSGLEMSPENYHSIYFLGGEILESAREEEPVQLVVENAEGIASEDIAEIQQNVDVSQSLFIEQSPLTSSVKHQEMEGITERVSRARDEPLKVALSPQFVSPVGERGSLMQETLEQKDISATASDSLESLVPDSVISVAAILADTDIAEVGEELSLEAPLRESEERSELFIPLSEGEAHRASLVEEELSAKTNVLDTDDALSYFLMLQRIPKKKRAKEIDDFLKRLFAMVNFDAGLVSEITEKVASLVEITSSETLASRLAALEREYKEEAQRS